MNLTVHRYSMKKFDFSYEGVENPAPFEGADESACLEAQERKYNNRTFEENVTA